MRTYEFYIEGPITLNFDSDIQELTEFVMALDEPVVLTFSTT